MDPKMIGFRGILENKNESMDNKIKYSVCIVYVILVHGVQQRYPILRALYLPPVAEARTHCTASWNHKPQVERKIISGDQR